MRFTRPVGPVATSPESGMEQRPDGKLYIYSLLADVEIFAAGNILLTPAPGGVTSVAGSLLAEGVISTGPVSAPSFQRPDGQVPMLRAGTASCTTNGTGFLELVSSPGTPPAHGGTTAPAVVIPGVLHTSAFGGVGVGIVRVAITSTRFQVRAFATGGTWLGAGVNIDIQYLALWP